MTRGLHCAMPIFMASMPNRIQSFMKPMIPMMRPKCDCSIRFPIIYMGLTGSTKRNDRMTIFHISRMILPR